jgi:hypothetical protein
VLKEVVEYDLESDCLVFVNILQLFSFAMVGKLFHFLFKILLFLHLLTCVYIIWAFYLPFHFLMLEFFHFQLVMVMIVSSLWDN